MNQKRIKALELDEIVSEILKYINSLELLSLRPICKKWDGLIKSKLRKRRDICIYLRAQIHRPHYLHCDIPHDWPAAPNPKQQVRNKGLIVHLQSSDDPFLPRVLKLFVGWGTSIPEENEEFEDCFQSILTICDIIGPRQLVRELVIEWWNKRLPPPPPFDHILDGRPARLEKILNNFSQSLQETLQILYFSQHDWSEDLKLTLELPFLQVLTLPKQYPYQHEVLGYANTRKKISLAKFLLNSCPNLPREIWTHGRPMSQEICEERGNIYPKCPAQSTDSFLTAFYEPIPQKFNVLDLAIFS